MVDDDGPSRRQLAKKQRRDAGDRSGDLAHKLMAIHESALARLELEEDLKEAVDRARATTTNSARRRAERSLAGSLRRFDIADVERKLGNVESTGVAEPALFHLAERWRARLIDEDDAAAAEFPGGNVNPLPKLIADAKRERTIGKPPGAAKALFRHVIEVLRAQAQVQAQAQDDDD